jgi:tetratricopeptide (TPR) repeat protein
VKQNKLLEAEEFHKKALKIRLNLFGESDVTVADSFNNLAIVYNKLKKYELAELNYTKSLEIYQ